MDRDKIFIGLISLMLFLGIAQVYVKSEKVDDFTLDYVEELSEEIDSLELELDKRDRMIQDLNEKIDSLHTPQNKQRK